MNAESELIYSNNLCAAFLTAIVKSFEQQHPDEYLGRTAMQKLTYFAQVLGAPIPCSFGIYTYGPYSDTVTFAVESMLADEVLQDRSANPKYSNYRTGPAAERLLTLYDREIAPNLPKIDSVVSALGRFKPNELELIATLHFIARRQEQIVQTKPDKASVIREFKSIKKDKFNDKEISAWYNALVTAGLI